MDSNSKQYNLEQRTSSFGGNVIKLLKKVSPDHINKPLINQLVKSATSIGANYMEANGGESRKDFMHKINICKKEARETKHFLQMMSVSNPEIEKELKILFNEAHELTLIFSAITKNK